MQPRWGLDSFPRGSCSVKRPPGKAALPTAEQGSSAYGLMSVWGVHEDVKASQRLLSLEYKENSLKINIHTMFISFIIKSNIQILLNLIFKGVLFYLKTIFGRLNFLTF